MLIYRTRKQMEAVPI